MRIWRAMLTLVILLTVLGACGGRAEVPAATIPGRQSEFGARQTEIAQQGAATLAAQPTATRTATPEPSPTATFLPTVTPGGPTREPVATSEGTPSSVVGVPATNTPEATPEGGETMAVISGCGTASITIQVTSQDLAARLEEWQLIGDASQEIYTAWDEFFAIVEDIILFNEVIDNTDVFNGAAAFIDVAEEQLPLLEEIEAGSPIYDLAQTIIASTEDQAAVAQLLTRAGREQDLAAWEGALAISENFAQHNRNIDAAHEAACDYWEAQS